MTDRELLELAAKAAGIELQWETPFVAIGDFAQFPHNAETGDRWDALTDDGDALRLAVKLRLDVVFYPHCACVGRSINQYSDENYENDPYAATRRAIVRASAAIGEQI